MKCLLMAAVAASISFSAMANNTPAAFTVIYQCKDTGAKLVINSGWGESKAVASNSTVSYEIIGKNGSVGATGLGGYIETAKSADGKTFFEIVTDANGKHSISAGKYPTNSVWGNDCPVVATLDHTKGE